MGVIRSIVRLGLAVVVLAVPAWAMAQPPVLPPARLRATHRAMVVECVDGAAAAPAREWTLTTQPVTLVATMKNSPRTGVANAAPGHATVTFTPEPGHRYEVEVRAPSMAFSRRVFAQRAWAPVVRDRTTERVVSGEPTWDAGRCEASPGASAER